MGSNVDALSWVICLQRERKKKLASTSLDQFSSALKFVYGKRALVLRVDISRFSEPK